MDFGRAATIYINPAKTCSRLDSPTAPPPGWIPAFAEMKSRPPKGAMYDFRIAAADKASLYRELIQAADGMTADETDAIANMANVAALLWESLPDLNWAGFYRNVAGELVLGPFQGRPACIRIAFGRGVCGAAAATLEPQCVEDVNAFPGHIACDAASASELVVPIVHDGRLIGVIDLDSPVKSRFDTADLEGCLELARLLAPRLALMENSRPER